MRSIVWGLAVVSALVGQGRADERAASIAAAAGRIDAEGLLGHIRALAADEMEGRGPGTAGEERTVRYLIEQFRSLGLKPGNPDGTYVQKVPLVGFQATSVTGAFQCGGRTLALESLANFVAVSRRMVPEVRVDDSEVVFVGYGVVAPEYGWDDYKGVDVRGKTIVMLVNDPAVPDPKDPGRLDPSVFKGKAMTYYGRWTYKYEIASEKGAAAAILVHQTGPAGYPFEVVKGSWGRENFDLPRPKDSPARVAVEGWITLETAKALCSAGGHDFDSLERAAARRDFKPVALGATARFEIKNRLRTIESQNVLAKVEGADPAHRDEVVVYTAHWDHLGRDPSLAGDQIFNGAADNASGVAGMLEIADAFAHLQPAQRRSIVFLAVTAEEKGLLGAKYYAEHPLYPLERTLADINMDVLNLWGRTRDVNSIGLGLSTLDERLAEAAKRQGRVVTPDAEPEKGFFYRSDHFEFAKQGVPALDPKGGVDYVDRPANYGRQKREEYTKNDYHKVSDEVKPDWDLSGAVEDLRLFFEVGDEIADGTRFPEWKPGAEFRAKREAKRAGTAR